MTCKTINFQKAPISHRILIEYNYIITQNLNIPFATSIGMYLKDRCIFSNTFSKCSDLVELPEPSSTTIGSSTLDAISSVK